MYNCLVKWDKSIKGLKKSTSKDENDHPAIYPVSLEGVSKNNDGLFTEKAFEKRLNDAVKEYDRLNEGDSAL